MAKLTDELLKSTLNEHLKDGETLEHWAIGVDQPSLLFILPLFLLAVVPGVIATQMLTKKYLVGLTNKRFIVLQIKGLFNMELKSITEYPRADFSSLAASYKTGALFTHIKIKDREKPFKCKFAKALTKDNKMHTEAIGQALSNL